MPIALIYIVYIDLFFLAYIYHVEFISIFKKFRPDNVYLFLKAHIRLYS